MADESAQPLLVHDREDQLWDRLEASPPLRTFTVEELLKEHPANVIRVLQREGCQKIGEFNLPDKLILGKIGDDSIVTMGADRPDIDVERAWHRELGAPSSDSTGWSTTIPVQAYVVAIRNAASADKEGLLQPLLRRWQAGGLSYAAFALPPVQAVIDWKWSRYCKRLLLCELACFLLWLFSFFTFTILFQDEDTKLSLREILATGRGRATVACNILALLGMAPFLYIEAATMLAYRGGWFTAWNMLDTATYFLQFAVVTMYFGRLDISSDYLSILAAMQCILLLFRLQYFSRLFRATRFSFLDSLKEVLHGVKFYLLFLLLIVFGYATAFHILYRRDQEQHDNFSTIGKSFVTMVTWVAGNADLNPLYEDTRNPVAASMLGITYVFVLGMVLSNLLISLMTNVLDKVTENEGLRMLLSKAQAIDEIEATLPPFVERMFPQLYPAYIHVLRVDPDKLDAVKLDQLWNDKGDDEEDTILDDEDSNADDKPSMSKSGGADDGQQQGLEAKVDALQAELTEVKRLLLAMQDNGKPAIAEQ